VGCRRLGWSTALLCALVPLSAAEAAAQACARPCVGPTRGAILAAGGGHLDHDIYARFLHLAGGPDARLVLIPTAGTQDGSQDAWTALETLRDVGARRIEVLHTRNRKVADLEAFVGPLREATGVWISGGLQYRLADVYLNTRTHRELQRLLDRGGVVGGNSAGASILASFLVRGSRDGNEVFVEEGRDEGFGFLRDVAIDQHLLSRGRENDLLELLGTHPQLLGIGLDEGSAVVVTGDMAEVVGRSPVAVYDITDPLTLLPLRWLEPGDVYDLGVRSVILVEEESRWDGLTGIPLDGSDRRGRRSGAPSSPGPGSPGGPAPP
jgi:cyanophycinase